MILYIFSYSFNIHLEVECIFFSGSLIYVFEED